MAKELNVGDELFCPESNIAYKVTEINTELDIVTTISPSIIGSKKFKLSHIQSMVHDGSMILFKLTVVKDRFADRIKFWDWVCGSSTYFENENRKLVDFKNEK